jgi:hypothetical protein
MTDAARSLQHRQTRGAHDAQLQRWLGGALMGLALLVVVARAPAEVRRFAVVVGANQGADPDIPLRYAEDDAAKVVRVLREVGDFHPSDVVLLRNEDAATFRSSLISVNERIRSLSGPGVQTVFLVYYSGHADANALRMRNTRLPVSELGGLVRGSAATFRLLLVDACRAGSITRLKGGEIVKAFALRREPELTGQGMAFLTASSANEDAQESDEIRGSFFTHALVSGLRGAADSNHDGRVVLDEAYRYAYDATLRATSRTYAGTQHPAFQYDFRGQDALVLSRFRREALATLGFPEGISFLVLARNSQGPVVAEVAATDSSRLISLREGRYFLRGRGTDVLYEGGVQVTAGQTVSADLDSLDRVEYARLVRKGGNERRLAHGVDIGGQLRSALPNSSGVCIGGVVSYRIAFENVSLYPRVAFCQGELNNSNLSATVTELSAQLMALHAWDLPWLTLTLGLGGGMSIHRQRFDTLGTAPSRQAATPVTALQAGLTRALGQGVYARMDVSGEAHLMRVQGAAGSGVQDQTAIALRFGLAVGREF